ncbi:hypothetical protein J2S59_000227 [Nocardioides massiliensis]|uniref:Uncharacterized protein n=1 Tax=Nocardioides massiliensis TaxID=1325935 RepID=A0ABT9NJ26_9ACTN|nr:hypothetical protein [Nocardioides massiliensis]MDP9820418.1 hypothetical protein [Nocardioides massiliensis]
MQVDSMTRVTHRAAAILAARGLPLQARLLIEEQFTALLAAEAGTVGQQAALRRELIEVAVDTGVAHGPELDVWAEALRALGHRPTPRFLPVDEDDDCEFDGWSA